MHQIVIKLNLRIPISTQLNLLDMPVKNATHYFCIYPCLFKSSFVPKMSA